MPEQNARIRSNAARNTIYTHGLPANHVIEVADGVQISCPELLFIELGTIMSSVVQLLVGLELCGRFSRCGAEPRNGPVTFGVKRVTTAKKIRAYLANANDVAGLEQSRRIAEWLMDEAWSPQESVVDALARMPLHELGYELGELRLNPRVMAGGDAELLVAKRSRVPDTLVVGTSVGFNYHGRPHFGEDFDEDAEPNFQQNGVTAIGPLRAAIVADKHRDRDLLVQGLSVLPVTKEDLLERGGLDCVMLQAMSIIERLGQSGNTRADSPLLLSYTVHAATMPAAWAAEDIAAAHGGGNPWGLFGWPRALARTGRAWRRHDAWQGPLVLCRANGFGCTFRNLRRPIATMMVALGCALCTAPSCLEYAGMTLDSYEGCAARHLPLPLDIRAGCMACFPARACSGLESGAVSGARDFMHGEDSTRSRSSPEGFAFGGAPPYTKV